jgi:hypothetical protein
LASFILDHGDGTGQPGLVVSVFPDELYQAPKSWAERAYPNNLVHYKRLDVGGHFAVWEQPQLFSEEMRESFRSVRPQPS